MLLALLACAPDLAEPTLEQLEREIAGVDAWRSPPGREGERASCDGAHGLVFTLRGNDVALRDAVAGVEEWADGTVWVLDAYDTPGGAYKGRLASWKVEGWDSTWRDTFRAWWGEDGQAWMSGRVAPCVGCHDAGVDGVVHPTTPDCTP